MKLKDTLFITITNLQKRRLRSWLTITGVVIGTTAVVALISLGTGLQNFVEAQFGIISADVITIKASGINFGPPGSGAVNPLTKTDLKRVKNVKGVKEAIGRLVTQGKITFNEKTQVRFIGSIPNDNPKALYDLLSFKPEEGRLLKSSDKGKIIVGSEYTNEEWFGKPVMTGNKIIINGKEFEVVGILEKKGSFVTDTTIGMLEDDFNELFKKTGTYSVIIAKPENNIDYTIQRIKQELRRTRNVKKGKEDFTVETSKAVMEKINQVMFAVQLFVYIIALISILVGAIGITNTMYTAVLERTKEIGIMKAIGARNKHIAMIFSIESGLIGLIGGFTGTLLGIIIAYSITQAAKQAGFNMIIIRTSPTLIISTLTGAFIIGLIAGVMPAMRAAKMHPVKALRS